MKLWLFSALLVYPAADPSGATPLRTPPPESGVVCGHDPRLELADVRLTPDTTYAEMVAVWGEPRSDGPAGEVAEYYLHCNARLWLSFEPQGERRLTRAILFSGSQAPTRTVILNSLDVTERRQCAQLHGRRRLTGRQIAEIWGPPDDVWGSGIVRWVYTMADGGLGRVIMSWRVRDRYMVSCTPGDRMGGEN